MHAQIFAFKCKYVKTLSDTGTAIILVIVSGRPRLLNGLQEVSAAVLEAYLPGPMGGQAVAEVLAGVVAPSGRLPFTYPKNAGDFPYPYHRKLNNLCISSSGSWIPCEVCAGWCVCSLFDTLRIVNWLC